MGKQKLYDVWVDPAKVSAVWNKKGFVLQYKGHLSKTAKRPRSTKYQLFDENRCPNQSDALAHKEKFVNELEKELGSKRAYESPVAAPPPTEPVATADVRHTRDPKRQKLMQKKEAKRKEAADKRHASYVAERWFRSHCSERTADLKGLALESMSSKVISLAHAMKFARKARDFFRAYRTGASGGDVEKQRRRFRAHRCMLDCYYTFITEEQAE